MRNKAAFFILSALVIVGTTVIGVSIHVYYSPVQTCIRAQQAGALKGRAPDPEAIESLCALRAK